MNGDTITVLKSLSSPLTKTIVATAAGGVETRTQQNVKFYSGEEVEATDIRSFAAVLENISSDPYKCVVRGAITPGTNRKRMLRRTLSKESEPPTLIETARRWLLLDVDGFATPADFDPLADPGATVKRVRSRLPACFQEATCWYQFTGSAGIKPGLHIRLGFWLDQPLKETELKQWLARKIAEPGKSSKSWFREYPIDPAVFTTAQPIYVAAPIIKVGARDPLANRCARSGVVDGALDTVVVPPIEAWPTVRRSSDGAAPANVGGTFAECLASIGDHEGGDGCHNALKRCVAVYWRRHGSKASATKLKKALTERMALAEWNDAVHPPIYRKVELERVDTLIESIRGQQLASEQSEAERRARATCPWPDFGIPLSEAEPILRGAGGRFFQETVPEDMARRRDYETAIEEYRKACGHSGAEIEFGEFDADDMFTGGGEPETPEFAQQGIRITPGGGKTFAAIEEMVALVRRVNVTVAYAVPTHSKAEEIEADIKRTAREPIAATWRGIDREDPENAGQQMCRRATLVKAVVKSSGSITDVCGSPERGFCPFREECGYRRQMDRRPRIWVVTHATLATKPHGAMKDVAALVVDEALTLGNAREDVLPVSDFAVPRQERASMESWLRRARTALGRVEPGAYLPRSMFEAEGFTADICDGLARREAYQFVKVAPTFEPAASDADIAVKIEPAAAINGVVRTRQAFWRNLAEFLRTDEPSSARLQLSAGDDASIRISIPARPHPTWLQRPLLHLDATLDESVVSTWLPRFELIADIRIERGDGVTVHQVTDQAVSYGRVVPGAGGDKSREKRSAQESNAQRIMRAIEVRAAEDRRAGGATGVVVPKGLEEHMEATWRQWRARPANLLMAHFGNVRGRNNLESCRRIVVISRPEPQAGDIERAQRQEFGRHPKESIRSAHYPSQITALRTTGNAVSTIERAYHPDPRANALLEQVREAEVIQAVHRARPVRRSKDRPLVVEIVTGIALDLTIDTTGTFAEWLETSPAGLLVARGFWPVAWEGKQAVLGDLFPTAQAVRRWFEKNPTENALRVGVDEVLAAKHALRPYKDIYIRPEGMFRGIGSWPLYRYKGAGARKSHLVALDPVLHPDARAAWESRTGALSSFEPIGQPPTAAGSETYPSPLLWLSRAPSIASDIFGTDRRDPSAPPFPAAPTHLRTLAGSVRFWPREEAGEPIVALSRPVKHAAPLLTVEAICEALGISQKALQYQMARSRHRRLTPEQQERAAIQWMTLKVGREQLVSVVRRLGEQLG